MPKSNYVIVAVDYIDEVNILLRTISLYKLFVECGIGLWLSNFEPMN